VGQPRLTADRGARVVGAGGVSEEGGDGESAEAAGAFGEELAAGFELDGGLQGVHGQSWGFGKSNAASTARRQVSSFQV